MRLFRISAFAAGNASAFLLYGALYSEVYFLSQYLQVSLGFSPLQAGVRTLAWTATLFVVAPAAGSLVDRIGPRRLLCLGLLMQGAGFAWIALNAHAGRGYPSSIAALVIAGVGVSMAMPAGQNAVLNSVEPGSIGTASGTFNALRQLGGVFGIAVLVATFGASGSYLSPSAFNDGVAPAFFVAAGMSALGALIGLATPGRADGVRLAGSARPADTDRPAGTMDRTAGSPVSQEAQNAVG
jgi:MFS family permease